MITAFVMKELKSSSTRFKCHRKDLPWAGEYLPLIENIYSTRKKPNSLLKKRSRETSGIQ